MTGDVVAQTRALHLAEETHEGLDRCQLDGYLWPCHAILLADEAERLRRGLDVETLASANDRITAAEAVDAAVQRAEQAERRAERSHYLVQQNRARAEQAEALYRDTFATLNGEIERYRSAWWSAAAARVAAEARIAAALALLRNLAAPPLVSDVARALTGPTEATT
ncbi:MAG: hypothetical protein ACTHMS_23585 [Jatrophihabitans sp.]|uniref:hypothetical protein n=1 Tax=Jatrophihabitans sp. TaxID=1932789 RepID=UPI003F7D1111